MLASERADEQWDSGPDATPRRSLTDQHNDRLDLFAASLNDVTDTVVSSLSDAEVRVELACVQTARARLDARACRLTSALTSRASSDARAAHGDDPRAGERAARQVRNELAGTLRLSAGEVKRAQQIGDRVDGAPNIAAALDAGTISPDHVRAMDRTLDHLSGKDRAFAEAELLAAAATGTPRDVNDTGTRLLASLDHQAAVDAAEARHHRRSARTFRTADGMTRTVTELEGLDAEVVSTAFHAWRRPDRPDERRTPEQRSADAFVDLARASITGRSDITVPTADGQPSGPTSHSMPTADGQPSAPTLSAPTLSASTSNATPSLPPTNHGVRPHVVVTVNLETVLAGSGIAETEWTGPVIWDHVKHLLDDCGITFIALRDQLPVAVTEEVRTVPVGLWKALQLRDDGCVRTHCDIPSAWTQVAHLANWFKDGGKLTIDASGLLCHADHRDFDAGRLAVTWIDGRPHVHPPGQPPDQPRGDPP